MSLIMLASDGLTHASNLGSAPESGLRGLLDHLAGELAEEYVRLMEAAARDDTSDAPRVPPRLKGQGLS